MTSALALPLCHEVLAFDAEHYIEGHHPSVTSRAEMEELVGKLRWAEAAAREGIALAEPDEDTEYFLKAFGTD